MAEISVFEAKCNECKWKLTLLSQGIIEYHAEEHMMESGHTVQITEIR